VNKENAIISNFLELNIVVIVCFLGIEISQRSLRESLKLSTSLPKSRSPFSLKQLNCDI